MATFAVSISFDVQAGSYDEARDIQEAIIAAAVDLPAVNSGHEIDVEHMDGDLEDDE